MTSPSCSAYRNGRRPRVRSKAVGSTRVSIVSASVLRWFDADAAQESAAGAARGIDWLRVLPFIAMHVACLGVIWVGWSPPPLRSRRRLYLVRMFAITGFYHRYFSHRAFRTTRALQFVFAVLGATAVQRGPLWWAAHHRHHHAHADAAGRCALAARRLSGGATSDGSSPSENFACAANWSPDLARFPELRFLDRFDSVAPLLLAVLLFAIGAVLERTAPQLGVERSAAPGLGLLHLYRRALSRRLSPSTPSRTASARAAGRRATTAATTGCIALLTFGEGWHNNHHHCPGAARQGFDGGKIDLTYYVLRADGRARPDLGSAAGSRATCCGRT